MERTMQHVYRLAGITVADSGAAYEPLAVLICSRLASLQMSWEDIVAPASCAEALTPEESL